MQNIQAKQSTGDYHGQMDYRNFSKWFKKQLLPNIPPRSLIFGDQPNKTLLIAFQVISNLNKPDASE